MIPTISEIAGRSAVTATAPVEVSPPTNAGAVVLNSAAAKEDRSAPALVGVSSLTSATPDPSPVLIAGSGVADFSDDAIIAALERAWVLQRSASELPRVLQFSKNTVTLRTTAPSDSISNSTSLVW